MAFWRKINGSKLSLLLSFRFKGTIDLHHAQAVVSASKKLLFSQIGNRLLQQSTLGYETRFYGTLAQAKCRVDDINGPTLNEMITFKFVRLVTEEGHNVIPACKALELAKQLNLDLVLVQRDADPPVCKIYDYKKEKFQQKVREKERNKAKVSLRKGDCKEIRFSVKTESKDLKMKADTIKRLIGDGYRVKCVALPPKGVKKIISADGHAELGKEMKTLFASLISLVEDDAIVESEPTVSNGLGHMIVRHAKFGPTKRSTKSKDVKKSTSEDVIVCDEKDEVEKLEDCVDVLPIPNPADCFGRIVNGRQSNSRSSPVLSTDSYRPRGSIPPSAYQRIPQVPAIQVQASAATENNRYAKRTAHLSGESDQNPNEAAVLQQEPCSLPSFYHHGATPKLPRTIVPGRQGVAVENNRYTRKPSAPNSDFNGNGINGGLGSFGRDGPSLKDDRSRQARHLVVGE